MRSRRFTGLGIVEAALALALPFWLALGTNLSAADHHETAAAPAEELFRDEQIPRLRLEISPANMDRLRTRPRGYVEAAIREGDHLYTNVSIHLKGGPGSFRPLDDRPAFTVNFGRDNRGQKFHGLKKLHLNNSVQDSTYLSEKISRELFATAGVPAPRAAHAVVELNGRLLGLYVLVEGIDHQFLQRYFQDARANLYDGHSQSDVTHGLKLNSGDTPRDRSALAALAAAAREPDLARRQAALDRTLDLDRFLSFLAVEVLVCHWDGYALNRNNYRIYHDRARQRMVFLPQGVDQTFQRPNIVPLPPMVGLVAKSVLEIPVERERYQARLRDLLTNVFNITAITNRLREVAAKIEPVLEEIDSSAAAAYAGRVATFRRRIQRRFNAFTRQLCAPPAIDSTGLETTAAGIPLPAWAPKIDRGHPALQKDQRTDGSTLLEIAATAPSAGSWRTTVPLDSGKYRLEGKIKLEGVKLSQEDTKTGAGLRISRRHFASRLSGTQDWQEMPFDFEVQEEHAEVELVCELRAAAGRVWFDLASLHLRRLE